MIMTRCAQVAAARERQPLPLAARKVLDRLGHGADADLELFEVAGGLAPHRGLVEHAQNRALRTAAAQLSTEEDVRRDIERRGTARSGRRSRCRLLERRGRPEMDGLPVEADLAFVHLERTEAP
jgi:hypothetical protein